jgi:hypothetical protein
LYADNKLKEDKQFIDIIIDIMIDFYSKGRAVEISFSRFTETQKKSKSFVNSILDKIELISYA